MQVSDNANNFNKKLKYMIEVLSKNFTTEDKNDLWGRLEKDKKYTLNSLKKHFRFL